MGKNKEKYTFREDLAMILRGFRINWQMTEGGMVWRCGDQLARHLVPYFGLYMSARIVDAIADGAVLSELLKLAVITVTGELVLNSIKQLLIKKNAEREKMIYARQEFYLFKAMNRMQYKYFEQPDTALLYEAIRSNHAYGGYGLQKIYFFSVHGLAAISEIVMSMALTVSMFRTLKGAKLTGFLAFVNHPFSAVTMLLLIAVNVLSDLYRQRRYLPVELGTWQGLRKKMARSDTMYTGNYDMQIFGGVNLASERTKKDLVDDTALKRSCMARGKSNVFSAVSTALMQLGLWLYVGAKAYIGVFGIGSFVLYRGTVEKFVNGISDLVKAFTQLRENNRYLQDVYRLADLPDEMYRGTLSVEKRDDNRFEIEFRGVSFRYPGSDAYALKNVSFRFRIGERLAFVGMNGSGKTTFVKLLCRLYDPTEGTILLNGIDITRYDYDQYMRLFSVVFQDYGVFGFDVAGNVSVSMHPDRERIEDCLERVGLGERMRELENGIGTYVSKEYDASGTSFSGGELQKMAIARALYKDAPFIIMDEPTAALDPLAEADIYARLDEIIEDKTAIYISHRLSSCKFCDEIAVFHEGEIIQKGSHEALLADEKGKYHELWQAQAQYYQEREM